MIRALLALLAPAILALPRMQGSWGVAYAPADTSTSRPAIVFLHGMWTSPEEQCAYFERPATPFGFLVCPRGNSPNGAYRMWTGNYGSVAPSVRAALRGAAALAPGKLDRSGGTIVGYSNGAYFAVEVAQFEPGRWTGLVLLSMRLELDVARLRAAGVQRIVLAAGDRDGARTSMRALAAGTEAAGLSTRFMSLGPGGHELPSDIQERMCIAISWVRAADSAACGGGLSAALEAVGGP